MAKTTVPKPRPGSASAAGQTVVTLKVTLRGIKPPIWRRLLLPAAMTLGQFHQAIQAAMGWHGGHLHAFDIDGRQYGDPAVLDDVANQNRLTLAGLLKSGVGRFSYVYDFGDNWDHAVVIERTQPVDDTAPYPACVAGKRNCPPEDCGGPWGYLDFIAAISDPSHPQHAEQREWLGENFDPDAFDINHADAVLKARFER